MSQRVLNVVHVTSWLSRQGGGIPPVVSALAGTMTQQGVKVTVLGQDDPWVKTDFVNNGFPLLPGKVIGPESFGFSPDLKRKLQTHLTSRAVIHSHGLWMYSGIAARKTAVRNHSPLVVSPHGMLEPWALQNSRWKKRLAGWLFENKNLRQAGCLHALCPAEAENFRRYGLRNPIAVIPNGIALNEFHPLPDRDAITERFPAIKNRRRLLFLSRLHPKKGLEMLLRAWRQLSPDFKDWCLLIAGGGQPAYEQELRTLVKNLALEESVFFLGPVYGEGKRQALAAADCFVLPSFSEGFSMAILEAAAAGLPVLLTHECNFPELARVGGGVEVATEAKEIQNGLQTLLRLSGLERKAMGRQGQSLIEQGYSWPTISRQFLEVYEWLAGTGQRPECVRLD